MSPENLDLEPGELLPHPQPLGQRADRRQRLDAELVVPLPAGETVDDRDGVALPRQVKRRRPAAVPSPPSTMIFIAQSEGPGPPCRAVLCMHSAAIRRRGTGISSGGRKRPGAAIYAFRFLHAKAESVVRGPVLVASGAARVTAAANRPLGCAAPSARALEQLCARINGRSAHSQRDRNPLNHHRHPLPHPDAHRAERIAPRFGRADTSPSSPAGPRWRRGDGRARSRRRGVDVRRVVGTPSSRRTASACAAKASFSSITSI